MKSLSILCEGGRGQTMLAGMRREGLWSQKSQQRKKGGPLAIKNGQNKMKKENSPN
jgi:hypothetical protein